MPTCTYSYCGGPGSEPGVRVPSTIDVWRGEVVCFLGTATPCCASQVNGGFGNGGTSYIGTGFALPAVNKCAPWSGFTKTASTVITIASGTGCLSTNGKVLTLSISNTDPSFLGANVIASDQITLCPEGVTGCTISGQDQGYFGGSAAEETCTAALLKLPVIHD